MAMNLRELTRKVGVGRGLRIDAVGHLALQMLVALKQLRAAGVLHADIKPDNILINERLNKVKLCDLGSAVYASSRVEPTPYLVSRFYRAPEVILGLPYGAWSHMRMGVLGASTRRYAQRGWEAHCLAESQLWRAAMVALFKGGRVLVVASLPSGVDPPPPSLLSLRPLGLCVRFLGRDGGAPHANAPPAAALCAGLASRDVRSQLHALSIICAMRPAACLTVA
jgi:serine/threonine protein kinase